MIKNKKRKGRGFFTSFIMVAVIMTACDLEIQETDSLITEGGSDVFNGVESPSASVTNLYNLLRDQMGSQEELYALSEVSTDTYIVPTRGTDWGDNGVWRTLHTHLWGPTHRDVIAVWNNKNSLVLRATEVIDPLSNADAEQLAQAKFVRAYCMWIIMDGFSQVPFRNPTDGPDVIPSVMTRAAAYDMIVADLNDAIAGLPNGTPNSADKTNANKQTAQFLLAKVKLNAAVYKGSYGATDLQDVVTLVDAIDNAGYNLVGNYFSIFQGPTFTNTDVIWALNSDVGSKMWSGLHYNQGHSTGEAGGGWNGFTTLAEFYDKFEANGSGNNNAIGGPQEERRGYTHTLASTTAMPQPPASPPDAPVPPPEPLAKNGGFGYGFQIGQMYGWRYNGAPDPVTGVPSLNVKPTTQDAVGHAVALTNRTGAPLSFTKELPGLTGNNEITGIRLLKYSPANGAHTGGTVLFRFADAHLMRAEAKLRGATGGVGAALIEVNALRAMRTNTPALLSLTEATLLDERGRELYGEFVRRNDMVRFGAFKNARGFKEAGDGHTDIFPIPASALLSNPNLVQNPGY